MNTPKTQSGGSLKPLGSDFRCPVCRQRASFIRTRYFENGTADVWTCNDPKCSNHMLYFYNDHPNDRGRARRENP
jgi:hypothetical protein